MWAPNEYAGADLLGVTEEGAVRAGAEEAAFAALRIPNDPERNGPMFAGTLTEFAAAKTAERSALEAKALDAQLHNLVRKCAACGKACGSTMVQCNGCNAVLPEETVHTDNIFIAFVYGIAKVRHSTQLCTQCRRLCATTVAPSL